MSKSKDSKRGGARVPRDLETALRQAIRFLEKHNIKYAVIGGLATSQWGYERYTADLDFKIFVPNTDYPAMRELLRRAFPENPRPHIPNHALVLAVEIDGVIVDFGMGYPGFDELVIERAVEYTAKGYKIRFATPEDLIILKVIANRGKDWQDIEGLVNSRVDDLDFGYMENWMVQFAEALERPELMQRYQEIVANAQKFKKK